MTEDEPSTPDIDFQDVHADLSDDIHDLNTDLAIEPDDETIGGTGVTVDENTVIRLVDSVEDVGIHHRTDIDGDHHQHDTVLNVRKCPNCNWKPTKPPDQYDDPPELKPACGKCGLPTCVNCHTTCDTCDTPLCSDHRDGFSTEEATLCPTHAQERREERQFEAEVELAEQRREDEQLRLQYEIQQQQLEIQRYKAAVQERANRNRERIQLVKAWFQEQHRARQHDLQVQTLRLRKAVKERELALQQFETAAKIQLKQEMNQIKREYYQGQLAVKQDKIDLQKKKLDFQRLKHDDQMELKQRTQRLQEQKERFQQRLKEERHELQQIKGLLSVANRLDSDSLQRNVGKAAKKLAKRNGSLAPTIS